MKLTKKLAAIAMALTMTFSTTAMTMTASADEWVAVNNGYKYQLDDGSYAKKGWLTVDGQKYYIKSNGFRAKGMYKITETVNKKKTTNYYYFDETDGTMQTGWQEIDGKKYYFRTSNGTRVTNKKIVIGSYSYKFDKNGKWNGIVYSKDGKKNVTKKVDVDKLTSNTTKATTTTSNKATTSTSKKVSGEVPKTVTINGQVLNTSATNKFVGTKADAIYPKGNDGSQTVTRYSRWAIDISGCTDKDLEVLKYFANVERLYLVDWENTSKVTNLDFCQYMPKLKTVYVQGAINLTDVSGLGSCKNLQKLDIELCKLTNLDGLENLKNLKDVGFVYTWLDNLDGLVNCDKLEKVEVNQGRLTDISALANKNKLTYVSLNTNRRLKDITALTKCANLEEISLCSCTSVNTWDTLKKISSLNRVSAAYNVIGKNGPDAVAEWLKTNNITVAYGNPNRLWDGTHPDAKESATFAKWDAKYRPSNVHGDDLTCGAGCEWCKVSKDSITHKHGLN